MKCPNCNNNLSIWHDWDSIVQGLECMSCGGRWSSDDTANSLYWMKKRMEEYFLKMSDFPKDAKPGRVAGNNLVHEVVGKTEKDATEMAKMRGFRVRICKKDGIPAVLTRDHRPYDRINIEIVNGIVTEAHYG